MLDSANLNHTLARLEAASAQKSLSPSQREQALDLSKRLRIGARIFVLGPRDSGKSHLCSAVLGMTPPETLDTCSQVFCLAGAEPDAFLHQIGLGGIKEHCLSTEALGQVQLIDFHEDESADIHAQKCAALLPHADIVLWCTQTFADPEASSWSLASDALKDRSFLVLTKADILAESGALNDRIQELQAIAAEEFYSLHPVSTKAIVQSLEAGQGISDQQSAASGVKALIEAVAHITKAGQRADLDSALLFLERHNIADVVEPLAPPEALVPQKEVAQVSPETGTPAGSSQYQEAYDRIMERAFDLAEVTFDVLDGDMTEVLETCASIAEELVDILSAMDVQSDEDERWRVVMEEAADKITLMGMENDTRSAADAVTILLQLRRDLAFLVFDHSQQLAA